MTRPGLPLLLGLPLVWLGFKRLDVSARLAAVGPQLRHATNARHAADKGQAFAVAGAVWGPRLSHVGSHAAENTTQGKHGNSGNLLRARRGVPPASGPGTANPPQAPRQTDPRASRYVTSAGHCRELRSFTGLEAGATASLIQIKAMKQMLGQSEVGRVDIKPRTIVEREDRT